MKKDKPYTGEDDGLLYVNKRIVITREDGVPYLIRRTLIGISNFFSIKHHQILQSDDACSHDHPWPFITIILKGGYFEWTPFNKNDKGDFIASQIGHDGVREICKWHGPGSILYRPASWRHRLELQIDETGTLIPAHTLVFTGKVIRKWGFFTKLGWIYWKDYTKQKYC